MGWLDKINEVKNAFSGSSIPNPNNIPAPGEFSSLLLSPPEEIISEYISMREKTESFFEYSNSTESIFDYGTAIMRYAAYSSVCIFGVNLYFVNHENGVDRLIPENLNNLLYDKILFDIADFSWVMLQYCFDRHSQSSKFNEDKIRDFLNSEHIPQMYWTLVFSFMVNQSNAEYAYSRYQDFVRRLDAIEPEKLENLPSQDTKSACREMMECGLIGDPNTYCLFDAKHMIDNISKGPVAIEQLGTAIRNSTIFRLLEPEVRLHLVHGY